MKKLLVICLTVLLLSGCGATEKCTVEFTVPTGSMAEFVYSDAEIIAVSDTVIIFSQAGLGDTEVVLKPVDAQDEKSYGPTYLTRGMPVEMEVEPGARFQIGVSIQNDSTRGPIAVAVEVENAKITE